MKGIIKKVVLYLGVAFLAFIATVVLCAGFLFFYRDGNIFGFKYIKEKEILYAYADEYWDIEKINIVGKDFPINIQISSNVEVVAGALRNNVYGYTRTSYAPASFDMAYDEHEKMITFDVTEPKGWLARNGSTVEIVLPENYVDKAPQIIATSNKGKITVGNDTKMSVSNLELSSSKGDIKFGRVLLSGDLTVDIGSGEAFIDKSVASEENIDCYIKVGSGALGINNIEDSLKIDSINILKNRVGEIYFKTAQRLLGDIDGGGIIKCDKVETVDFKSRDTDVEIGTISGVLKSRIQISGRGKVEVGEASALLEVEGCDGSVNIKSALNELVVATNNGNVTIAQASRLVSATTDEGDVKIKFSQGVGDYTEGVLNVRCVHVATKNGNVVVDGLQNGTVTVDGKGRVSLNYNRVVGKSNINCGNGIFLALKFLK